MDEEIEIIEKDIVYAVKIEVEARIKRKVSLGSSPEFELLSLAGVEMKKVEDERDLAMEMVRVIHKNVIAKIIEYEKENSMV